MNVLLGNVKTNKVFKDGRGEIQMILDKCDVKSVSRIISKPFTTRARHYHSQSHICIVNYGLIHYYERELSDDAQPYFYVLKEGDIFYTRPNVVHEMYFPILTSFDCYSSGGRDQANYEDDTVRVNYSLRELYASWPYKNG